jgi:hypothetical protein
MFKYSMLIVAMLVLSSCNSSRSLEAKAYSAGCSDAVEASIAVFGFKMDKETIVELCNKEGQRYIGNVPKDEKPVTKAPEDTRKWNGQ